MTKLLTRFSVYVKFYLMSGNAPIFNENLTMNLEEIARLSGVSKSTVSRVVNNETRVSPRTRAKVMAVIEKEGYQPNPAARTLVTRRTKTIGIVISNDISILFDTSFYFPTILHGIAQATKQRDYAMLLTIGDKDEDDLRFARRIVRGKTMDGVLLISPSIGHPIIDELLETNTLFVSADRIPRDDANINFITVENVESSRTAVNHLIKLGRRRIAMIAGAPDIIDSLDRVEGYKLALHDAEIEYDPQLVTIDQYTYETGYKAIQRLLNSGIPFDGVYASQSTIAVGAVNALLDAGIRLPEDVSLIAFDDLADAMHPRIGISTMRQPILEKGQRLANTLIDLIEGRAAPPIQCFLPTEIVIRDTCGGLEGPKY
jgi:DNA-binding LacI/PurR family transcriptional regulator